MKGMETASVPLNRNNKIIKSAFITLKCQFCIKVLNEFNMKIGQFMWTFHFRNILHLKELNLLAPRGCAPLLPIFVQDWHPHPKFLPYHIQTDCPTAVLSYCCALIALFIQSTTLLVDWYGFICLHFWLELCVLLVLKAFTVQYSMVSKVQCITQLMLNQ